MIPTLIGHARMFGYSVIIYTYCPGDISCKIKTTFELPVS